ncbi:vitamin B12 transporter BtuB, partial [Striga asiatica]
SFFQKLVARNYHCWRKVPALRRELVFETTYGGFRRPEVYGCSRKNGSVRIRLYIWQGNNGLNSLQLWRREKETLLVVRWILEKAKHQNMTSVCCYLEDRGMVLKLNQKTSFNSSYNIIVEDIFVLS